MKALLNILRKSGPVYLLGAFAVVLALQFSNTKFSPLQKSLKKECQQVESTICKDTGRCPDAELSTGMGISSLLAPVISQYLSSVFPKLFPKG